MFIRNLTQHKKEVQDYMFVEKIPIQKKIDFLIFHIGGAENDEEYTKLLVDGVLVQLIQYAVVNG